MNKFLFICTGNGEFAHLKPLIRKVQEKGDKAIVLISENVLNVVKAERIEDMDIEVFRFNDYDVTGRMTVLCNYYKIDVVVTMPSRGWLMTWKRPECVKQVVTIESNLQFRGVGGSYRLDKVLPEWIDQYMVPWHPALLERSLYHHYGITNLDAYPELKEKVKAIGWVPSEKQKHTESREKYAFSYFGSQNTANEGSLQKLAEAYFEEENDRALIAVSEDIVTGNFSRLDVMPMVENYDSVLGNAREVYLHEGYGSIIKCISNKVPVMSFCAKTPIKQMEILPLQDLNLAYVYTKPASALDIKSSELQTEIWKFREKRAEIRQAMKDLEMSGEDNFYNLIVERL